MSERQQEIIAFLARAGWGDAKRVALAADASARSYQRLAGPKGAAILMNAPPGGDQIKSAAAAAYNQTAHLAVDCRPFISIGGYLRGLGLSAPEILAADEARGLLLLEDLGDDLFASVLVNAPSTEEELYAAAIDVLLALHKAHFPAPHPGLPHEGEEEEKTPPPRAEGLGWGAEINANVPMYDAGALAAEVALLLEWYAPHVQDGGLSASAQDEYHRIWKTLFPALLGGPRVLVLRDYHAQNLFWLPQRQGIARVGLIDFQDALWGSPAYDLVSLLQDARRDVAPQLARKMLDRYCRLAASRPGFEATAFRAAYAVAGAQRNAKILGIFARLAKRDFKPAYLALLPRVLGYFRHNLSQPELAPLNGWFVDFFAENI